MPGMSGRSAEVPYDHRNRPFESGTTPITFVFQARRFCDDRRRLSGPVRSPQPRERQPRARPWRQLGARLHRRRPRPRGAPSHPHPVAPLPRVSSSRWPGFRSACWSRASCRPALGGQSANAADGRCWRWALCCLRWDSRSSGQHRILLAISRAGRLWGSAWAPASMTPPLPRWDASTVSKRAQRSAA